ncbi:hypothetical protein [Lyngbya confervoides]|uniref:Uncharacterized protein n=1 Tax=Lyngbya confervoides BDU141951 TaxID=1574623 RepID=A0ABD4T6Q6_9CYAN|nr:hypothetical protein [Lyngbya confervoides]MCM1984133.1 hypothetical protein [Lyngbya confervoides BDU141951]
MIHFSLPQTSGLARTLLGMSILFWFESASLQAVTADPGTLPVGAQVDDVADLSNLPDGNHQFCSSPEADHTLQGAGVCYWFTKRGSQFIGYYGQPQSDALVDCVQGQMQNDRIVGDALALSWGGAPWMDLAREKPFIWEALTLKSGQIRHSAMNRFGRVDLVRFETAELDLKNFYRYGPPEAATMNPPPQTCEVNDWISKISA